MVAVAEKLMTADELWLRLGDDMRLEAGTRLAIVADPRRRVGSVYRSFKDIRVLTERDSLDGGDVVPGWRVPVANLFSAA